MKKSGIDIPELENPINFHYADYFDYIQSYNSSRLSKVRDYLSCKKCQHLENGSGECNITLLTTGSDGRHENGKSKIEVLTYSRGEPQEKELSCLRRKINRMKREGEIFDEAPENMRNIVKETMSYFNNDEGRIFPCRVIDGMYIFGNRELLEKAKEKVYREISGKKGKKILEKTGRRKADFKRVMRSGEQSFKGETITHYSLQDGIAYYDPETGLASFKYGPLRTVQQSLMRDVLRLSTIPKRKDVLKTLPLSTVRRLYYLMTEDVTNLSPDEVSDLTDCYKYFLWIYHNSQRSFRVDESKQTKFDPKEVRNRIEAIDKLTSGNILKI